MGRKEEHLVRLFELSWKDPEYQTLMREHEALNARALEALERIPEPEKSAVEDYYFLIAQMERRLLFLACEHMVFPEDQQSESPAAT